jgi:hypothetical protein
VRESLRDRDHRCAGWPASQPRQKKKNPRPHESKGARFRRSPRAPMVSEPEKSSAALIPVWLSRRVTRLPGPGAGHPHMRRRVPDGCCHSRSPASDHDRRGKSAGISISRVVGGVSSDFMPGQKTQVRRGLFNRPCFSPTNRGISSQPSSEVLVVFSIRIIQPFRFLN